MNALIQFFQRLSAHPPLHALGWSLLHFCWQGTLVAILLASALLRARSAQFRYAASCFALALMVVLPVVTFARLAGAPHAEPTSTASSSLDRNSVSNAGNSFEPRQPWLDRMTAELDQLVPWILSMWCAGVVLLLSRLNLGLMAARRMKSGATAPVPADLRSMLHRLSRRLGVDRTVQLANSAQVDVPTVVGWLRPVILIPMGCFMGLSSDQVEAVLAHELAHIRRHDYLVNVLQSIVETLLFYHPAVWWVSKQMRRERELCCDDLAIEISGDSLAYAKALSFLEERRARVPMVALGANGGVLAMRIRRLLGCNETPAVSRLTAITLAAASLVTIGLCVGTVARAASRGVASDESLAARNLPVRYQKWLDEDVVWIIAPEEQAAFAQLKHDEERDEFMKQFWERRNPTPNGPENKAKDEHYRRIKFANAHFATARVPGWKTDRGRVYIVYGPPDQINAYPAGFPTGQGKPTEFWRYHLIEEHGVARKNVDMTFVDAGGHGNYQLVQSPVNPANN